MITSVSGLSPATENPQSDSVAKFPSQVAFAECLSSGFGTSSRFDADACEEQAGCLQGWLHNPQKSSEGIVIQQGGRLFDPGQRV